MVRYSYILGDDTALGTLIARARQFEGAGFKRSLFGGVRCMLPLEASHASE